MGDPAWLHSLGQIHLGKPSPGGYLPGPDLYRARLLIRGFHLLGGDEHQGAELSTVAGDHGQRARCVLRSAGRCQGSTVTRGHSNLPADQRTGSSAPSHPRPPKHQVVRRLGPVETASSFTADAHRGSRFLCVGAW
jgi:hypothetical protein